MKRIKRFKELDKTGRKYDDENREDLVVQDNEAKIYEGSDWIMLNSLDDGNTWAVDSYTGNFFKWKDLYEAELEVGTILWKQFYNQLNDDEQETVDDIIKRRYNQRYGN